MDVSQIKGVETPGVGVEQQLSAPQDVTSASQFFQTPASAHLPEVTIADTGASSAMSGGAEQMMMHPPEAMLNTSMPSIGPGGEMASLAPSLPGAESAAMTLAPGAESAALLNGVAPGAEPISPLIQLIMKMPGAMGVINSVFEFLGALFGGGNLIALFDPILWLQQASAAIASFTISFVEGLPAAIMHNTLNPNHWFASLSDSLQRATISATSTNVSQVASQPVVNSSLNISGPANLNKPIFENPDLIAQAPGNGPNMYGDWTSPNLFATNSGQQLMGNYSQSPTVPATTTTAPAVQTHHHAPTSHAPTAHHAPAHPHGGSHHAAPHHARPHVETPRPQQVASAEGAAQPGMDYMVQKGDSLWQIAQEQLGDGSRWGEIYQLNSSTIGGDPSLIHAGTQLKMPGADIATADGGHYIVQRGDNLWDISRHHFGDGSRWTEIYQNNQAVIGENPNLIYPGQKLDLPAGGDVSTVASANSHPALANASQGMTQVHTPVHHPTVHHAPTVSHHMTTAGHGPQLAQAGPQTHAITTSASTTVPAHASPAASQLHAQQPVMDTGASTAAQAPTGDYVPPQAATTVPTSFAKSVNAVGDAGVSTAGSPGALDPSGIDPSYMNKQP